MTENKGDLISREALKKKLRLVQEVIGNDENIPKEVFNLIDNAPTIEPEPYFEKAEKDKRIYEQGFKDGQNARPQGDITEEQAIDKLHETGWLPEHDRQMTERPQGKWIEEGTEIGAFGIKYTWNKCNKCGWSSSLVIPKNFCPNCGADMRGGKND